MIFSLSLILCTKSFCCCLVLVYAPGALKEKIRTDTMYGFHNIFSGRALLCGIIML